MMNVILKFKKKLEDRDRKKFTVDEVQHELDVAPDPHLPTADDTDE